MRAKMNFRRGIWHPMENGGIQFTRETKIVTDSQIGNGKSIVYFCIL